MKRILNYFKTLDIYCYFAEIKKHNFLNCSFLVCLIGGLVMGCVASGDVADFSIYSSDIRIFAVIFQGESIWAIFWSRTSMVLASTVIIWLCSHNKFELPIAFIFVTFRGFMLGGNILQAIATYGINGLIVCLFLSLPINFVLLCTQITMCTYGHRYSCHEGRKLSILTQSTGIFFIIQLLFCVFEVLILQVLIKPLIFVL